MAFYSAYQFALFRFLFGLYLTFVLIGYLLGAPDVFLADPVPVTQDQQTGYFAVFHILRFFQSGVQVQVYLGFLTILALLLSFGIARRWVAFVLWFGWIGMFFTQGRVEELHVFFVEWLLFICVVARSGEGLAWHRQSTVSWRLSRLLFWGSWFILALGLFMLGFQKMSNPIWRDGTDLLKTLNSLFAYDWVLVWGLRDLPEVVLSAMAWIYGSFLLAFPLMCVWRKSRQWAWAVFLFLLAGSLLVVSTVVEILAFMALVWFVFDRRWLVPSRVTRRDSEPKEGGPTTVFFDGDHVPGRAWSDFLCAEDVGSFFKFAPLGGKAALKKLGEDFDERPTVLVSESGQLLRDAETLPFLLKYLGGPWRILAALPDVMRRLVFRLFSWWMSLYRSSHIDPESCPEKRRRFLS